MGYQGDLATALPDGLTFSNIYAVVVSGDFPNPCGHALLFVPQGTRDGGYYFQVAEFRGRPRMMSSTGYARYLRENGKTEITRYGVQLRNPQGAADKLTELLGKTWQWGVLPNNCAAFVEDVARGGGSSAGLWSNCPRLESFDKPFYERAADRAGQVVGELERSIRRLYGVPF
jgi:hypothetical protein